MEMLAGYNEFENSYVVHSRESMYMCICALADVKYSCEYFEIVFCTILL